MDIKELIKKGESEKIEFKKSLRLKDEIGETVSAFSNFSGGKIIVGVDDKNKEVIGVEIGKNTIEDLANYIKQHTDAQVFPGISVESVGDKEVIVVEVKETDEKPVLFKGRPYKRVGKSTHNASAGEVRKLVVESKKIYWDERVCEGAALDDIDEEKIGWFLRKAKRERRLNIDPSIPVKEALNRIDLLKDGKLTNAAVLMFGKNPQKFLLQGKIKCAKFKGTKYVKPFIDMKVVLGGVYEQIDEAEKFVLNNIRKAAWTIPGQVEREEKWEYPPDAIREAIANAVAHRDYQSTANVHVSIFDDRVEVWSPGKLPEPLTPDDLKKEHKSIPINPLLAQALFLIKYIETWGTGTNDIVDYCVEAKLPEPIFQEASGGISVVLRKSRLTEEFLDKSGLNERQRKAIAYTGEKKQITNSIYREINDIGKVIAAAELNNLVDKKMLKVVGRGRATKYVLND